MQSRARIQKDGNANQHMIQLVCNYFIFRHCGTNHRPRGAACPRSTHLQWLEAWSLPVACASRRRYKGRAECCRFVPSPVVVRVPEVLTHKLGQFSSLQAKTQLTAEVESVFALTVESTLNSMAVTFVECPSRQLSGRNVDYSALVPVARLTACSVIGMSSIKILDEFDFFGGL